MVTVIINYQLQEVGKEKKAACQETSHLTVTKQRRLLSYVSSKKILLTIIHVFLWHGCYTSPCEQAITMEILKLTLVNSF